MLRIYFSWFFNSSIVSEDKLKKYTKQEVDLKNKKSKKLMESIVIANRIFAGLLSYEGNLSGGGRFRIIKVGMHVLCL